MTTLHDVSILNDSDDPGLPTFIDPSILASGDHLLASPSVYVATGRNQTSPSLEALDDAWLACHGYTFREDLEIAPETVSPQSSQHDISNLLANDPDSAADLLAGNAMFRVVGSETTSGVQEFGKTNPTPRLNSSRLQPEQVKAMETWFQEHIRYPYPDNQDFNQLGTKTGLPSTRVRTWFSNRRAKHKRGMVISDRHFSVS
jgi:hypothetical protein